MASVMPPRLDGWLLPSPPPSVVIGSRPSGATSAPSDTNAPPPFRAEAEVFERLQDRDRERVVDRRIVNTGGRDPCFAEGARTRVHRAGVSEVDPAVAGALHRLAMAEHFRPRAAGAADMAGKRVAKALTAVGPPKWVICKPPHIPAGESAAG